jgi:hypothetical protein
VRQSGLVSARQTANLGLTPARIRRATEAGLLRRAAPGVYDVPGTVAPATARTDLLDHRRRRAALLGLLAYGPRAISTGACALFLAGIAGVPADLTPEVALRGAGRRRSIPGIRLRRTTVLEWIVVNGFAVASPIEALAQAVPEMHRKVAVAVMDSALNKGLVSAEGLVLAHDLARYHDGVARTHRWWSEADGRAESPAETFARLNCGDAGIPADAIQLVVRDERGSFLGRVEFGWRLPDGRWLLVEVDGVDIHGTSTAMVADLHRQNGLITGSTLLRRYTGTDAMNGRLTTEVGQILRAARWKPGRTVLEGPLVLT